MSPFHSFYCPLSNDAIDVLLVKCVQFSSDDWSTKWVLRSLTHIPYSYLATSSATLDADNATFGQKMSQTKLGQMFRYKSNITSLS